MREGFGNSREQRDMLAEMKEDHGLSMGDLLRIGLEKAKPDLEAAYQQGVEDRYDSAKGDFEVTYWCDRWRYRHISITTDEEKEAAAALMYQAGWHSTACP